MDNISLMALGSIYWVWKMIVLYKSQADQPLSYISQCNKFVLALIVQESLSFRMVNKVLNCILKMVKCKKVKKISLAEPSIPEMVRSLNYSSVPGEYQQYSLLNMYK